MMTTHEAAALIGKEVRYIGARIDPDAPAPKNATVTGIWLQDDQWQVSLSRGQFMPLDWFEQTWKPMEPYVAESETK